MTRTLATLATVLAAVFALICILGMPAALLFLPSVLVLPSLLVCGFFGVISACMAFCAADAI
jgi:hypothetical protein